MLIVGLVIKILYTTSYQICAMIFKHVTGFYIGFCTLKSPVLSVVGSIHLILYIKSCIFSVVGFIHLILYIKSNTFSVVGSIHLVFGCKLNVICIV